MRLRREHVVRGALMLPLLVVLATGCIFSPDKKKVIEPPGPDNYLPMSTISNVIHNLKQAYIDRNFDEYAKLFTDDFQFYFDPNDDGVPDSWALGDELNVHRNMFGGQPNLEGNYVTGIELAFLEGEPDVDPQFADYKRVVLSTVDLRVDTRNEVNGDVTLYLTPAGSQAHLYFFQTEEIDPETEQPIWKIAAWKDLGTGALLAAR
jgi:hypothetical protein